MDSPFDQLVVREAKGTVTRQELQELHADPRQWLESLTRQRKTAEAHVASRRAKLRRMAHDLKVGLPGVPVPQEYLDAKYAADHANWNTARFINGLAERVPEVKKLVHDLGHTEAELADALEALALVRNILDHPVPKHGVDQATEYLDMTLDRLLV